MGFRLGAGFDAVDEQKDSVAPVADGGLQNASRDHPKVANTASQLTKRSGPSSFSEPERKFLEGRPSSTPPERQSAYSSCGSTRLGAFRFVRRALGAPVLPQLDTRTPERRKRVAESFVTPPPTRLTSAIASPPAPGCHALDRHLLHRVNDRGAGGEVACVQHHVQRVGHLPLPSGAWGGV